MLRQVAACGRSREDHGSVAHSAPHNRPERVTIGRLPNEVDHKPMPTTPRSVVSQKKRVRIQVVNQQIKIAVVVIVSASRPSTDELAAEVADRGSHCCLAHW